MNKPDLISEEQLNALLDNELDVEERAHVLAAIDNNPALLARYNELKRLKNLVVSAYIDIPLSKPDINKNRNSVNNKALGMASAALVLFGILIGWTTNAYMGKGSDLNFQYVEKLDTSTINGDKILLHINTNDESRVHASLQWAENVLTHSRNNHTHLDLEVVVNAEGLNILRVGSPYADKIATLTQEYENIKFLACGMAKQNAMFRENKNIKLLPQATDIPAALDQIVNRLQDGWTYLRG